MVHLYIFYYNYKRQKVMRKPKSYSFHEFINNVVNRTNMYRYDKVIFDYCDLYDKQVDGDIIKYKTDTNGKTYNVYICGDGDVRLWEVSVDGYIFEIGDIKLPTQSDTVVVTIKCDALFL